MTFSFHIIVPGSVASWAPMCSFACQTPKTAPTGSCASTMRPASKTSIGSSRTVPPASRTRATVASTSSLAMYVDQCGGAPSAPGIGGLAAATFLPSFVNIT